jgi:hypothetical protein
MSARLSAASLDSQKEEYVTDLRNRLRTIRSDLDQLKASILSPKTTVEDPEVLGRLCLLSNQTSRALEPVLAEIGAVHACFTPGTKIGSKFGSAVREFQEVIGLSDETSLRYVLLTKRCASTARAPLQGLLEYLIQPASKRQDLSAELNEATVIRSLRTRVAAEKAASKAVEAPIGTLVAVGGP